MFRFLFVHLRSKHRNYVTPELRCFCALVHSQTQSTPHICCFGALAHVGALPERTLRRHAFVYPQQLTTTAGFTTGCNAAIRFSLLGFANRLAPHCLFSPPNCFFPGFRVCAIRIRANKHKYSVYVYTVENGLDGATGEHRSCCGYAEHKRITSARLKWNYVCVVCVCVHLFGPECTCLCVTWPDPAAFRSRSETIVHVNALWSAVRCVLCPCVRMQIPWHLLKVFTATRH